MVKRILKKNRVLYECEECHLLYEERVWAEKCEAFCSKHHACSLEITKHATQTENWGNNPSNNNR